MTIAICIITFKRPNSLLRLFAQINKLELIKYPNLNIKIIVIDNDSHASAKLVCDEKGPTMHWPLEYYIEVERGIPSARNAALYHAGAAPDFIVFIDDDEVPEPNWLDELLSTQEKYNADAVVGPVISRFESSVPQWVIKGNFYQMKRYKTGEVCQTANTGNVLVKNEVINKEKLAFNRKLALTGSSDEYFFQEFVKRGYRIIWDNNAIVYEYVPHSRISVKWLTQRSYRGGLYYTFTQIKVNPSKKLILTRSIKGALRILFGFYLIIVSIFRGYHIFVNGAQSIGLGLGTFAGLFGFKYEEYKKIHGA